MEQQLLFLINREWTNPALDLFMAAMSSFDLWLWPVVAIGAGILFFGGFKARAMLVAIAITVVFADSIVCHSLKKIVARPRPNEILANVRIVDLHHIKPRVLALFKQAKVKMSRPMEGQIAGRSFPSSHTVNNFCAAVIITAFYRRWGWLYFVPASLVAYSRIYVGSHWPSDVVISIFLGFGLAMLLLSALEFLWRKMGGRVMPKTHATHPGLFANTTA